MAFARTLRHQPLGVIGIFLLVLFVVIAVLAPAISPFDPAAIDPYQRLIRLRTLIGLAPTSSAATSSPAFFRVHVFADGCREVVGLSLSLGLVLAVWPAFTEGGSIRCSMSSS